MTEACSILLPVGLGLAAIFLLLPRPQPYSALWGSGVGALALWATGWFLVRLAAITPETILFYVFSAIAIVSGSLLVTQRNPARAALAFALVILSTCGLFLLLAAPFLSAAITIIYAGAIVVTFLFVIMLAQQSGLSNADVRSREPLLASLAGFMLLGALLYVLHLHYDTPPDLEPLLHQADECARRFRDVQRQLDRGSASQKELRADLEASANAAEKLQELAGQVSLSRPSWAGRQKPLHDAIVDLGYPLAQWRATVTMFHSKQPIDADWLTEPLAEVRKALTNLANAHTQLGSLPPPRNVLLSNLSGPPANLPPNDRRRGDDGGPPPLPAENTAYLGRSLFSDYLLHVELGGTLLLIATIGAIAIATRK